jgi:peptidylprolyl isomerase
MYVALTALTTFGNSNAKKDSTPALKEAFAALEKIAINAGNGYLWQLQAEAATAVAKLEKAHALPFIVPTDFPQPLLQAQLLTANGLTGSPDALPLLTKFLGNNSPLLYRAALEGMQELSNKNQSSAEIIRKTFEASITALDVSDMAVRTMAASILGDSLFQNPSAVEPLMTTLENLRLPDDVEAIQEIISTLGKLKDKRAIDELKKQLDQPDHSVALAATTALKSITGQEYKDDVVKFFQPRYQDLDFAYLRSFPETVKVKMETIRGDVTMELYKDAAPFTVMSFLKLATQRSYYRGLTFHRVVPNFVVQGGDPRGDGWGGPGYSIRSEFSPLTYETGTLGIASAGKDTEGSQFFVTQSPQPHLDGRYTIFGKVTSGMEIVNRILVGDHIYDIKIIQ